jgi:hypothetical protein
VTTASGKLVGSAAVVVVGLAAVEDVLAERAAVVVAGPGLPAVHAAAMSISPMARAVPRNILGEFTAPA